MADRSGIEWCDATWNPIVGCSVISPGCTNCYAMRLAGTRLKHLPQYAGLTKPTKAGPVWTGEIRINSRALLQPWRWSRPRRIFVNSMSDLFHEAVPVEAIDEVFAVMALGRRHSFLVLTKRPQQMVEYFKDVATFDFERNLGTRWCRAARRLRDGKSAGPPPDFPLPNVWLGVSVEDQRRADERIPALLETPAAVRWISAEPLLGPVDIRRYLEAGLDWVVAGCESGRQARPTHPDWIRDLRDQCADAGVPFFFKQWGEWAPGESIAAPPSRTQSVAFWLGRQWVYGSVTLRESEEMHRDDEPDVYRVRTSRALLDGREHLAFPEVKL